MEFSDASAIEGHSDIENTRNVVLSYSQRELRAIGAMNEAAVIIKAMGNRDLRGRDGELNVSLAERISRRSGASGAVGGGNGGGGGVRDRDRDRFRNDYNDTRRRSEDFGNIEQNEYTPRSR